MLRLVSVNANPVNAEDELRAMVLAEIANWQGAEINAEAVAEAILRKSDPNGRANKITRAGAFIFLAGEAAKVLAGE